MMEQSIRRKLSALDTKVAPALIVIGLLMLSVAQVAMADDEHEEPEQSGESQSHVQASTAGAGGSSGSAQTGEKGDDGGDSKATKAYASGAGQDTTPISSAQAASAQTGATQVLKVFPTKTIVEIKNATTDPKVIEILDSLLTEIIDMRGEQARQSATIQTLTVEVTRLKSQADYKSAQEEFQRLKDERKANIEKAAASNILGGSDAIGQGIGSGAAVSPNMSDNSAQDTSQAAASQKGAAPAAQTTDEQPFIMRFLAFRGIIG